MPIRRLLLLLGAVATTAALALALTRPAATARAADPVPAPAAVAAGDVGLIVGPGRVEPISEEIAVSGEVPGRLRAVHVDEGARAPRGQVLAEVEPAEYRARLAAARAALAIARAEEARLVNGARREEREEARAAAAQAREVARQAAAERRRREALFADGAVAREELERAVRDERVAAAREVEQQERARLVDAAARADERARARAAIQLAEAQVSEAAVLLERTQVRSPVDGVVLRRHLRTGESLAVLPVPSPIVTLADVSALRVRADVDEADIGGLRAGAEAWVTADAYGTRRFPGRVVRVGAMVGRANVRTDRPAERIDHKVLETLILLDPPARLPIGLRVDAFIRRAAGVAPAASD
jgi:multidrug resistance efflux pump